VDAKKAVTVDRKPDARKKGRKNVAPGVADVKAKLSAQTGAKNVGSLELTETATQSLSAAASDTPQVIVYCLHRCFAWDVLEICCHIAGWCKCDGCKYTTSLIYGYYYDIHLLTSV